MKKYNIQNYIRYKKEIDKLIERIIQFNKIKYGNENDNETRIIIRI